MDALWEIRCLVRAPGPVAALMRERSGPTAKQNLAAIPMLFDWLVTGSQTSNQCA